MRQESGDTVAHRAGPLSHGVSPTPSSLRRAELRHTLAERDLNDLNLEAVSSAGQVAAGLFLGPSGAHSSESSIGDLLNVKVLSLVRVL